MAGFVGLASLLCTIATIACRNLYRPNKMERLTVKCEATKNRNSRIATDTKNKLENVVMYHS